VATGSGEGVHGGDGRAVGLWEASDRLVEAGVPEGRTAGTGFRIGPALRKARLLRGKSIEEASRETRIRDEYLQALERERFDVLLGDVYVRGTLRSYSTYLGLDADKVLALYTRHFGDPAPMLPDPLPAPSRRFRSPYAHLPSGVSHHPSWTFLIGVALLVLGLFAVLGLLRRAHPATAPRAADSVAAAIPVLPPTVTVALAATRQVNVTIVTDGERTEHFVLRAGESRSFEGNSSVLVELDRGGLTVVTVNGHALGKVGSITRAYRATFGPSSFGGPASPTPAKKKKAGATPFGSPPHSASTTPGGTSSPSGP
jgi:cytoskeleton protein RodZ